MLEFLANPQLWLICMYMFVHVLYVHGTVLSKYYCCYINGNTLKLCIDVIEFINNLRAKNTNTYFLKLHFYLFQVINKMVTP